VQRQTVFLAEYAKKDAAASAAKPPLAVVKGIAQIVAAALQLALPHPQKLLIRMLHQV